MASAVWLRDLDSAALRNPWELFDAWRAAGPVVALEGLGGWAVTDHGLAEEVLRDPATWSSDSIDGPLPAGHSDWVEELARDEPELAELLSVPLQTLLALDPPDHGRLRRVLLPLLSAARIRRLEAAVAAHAADLAPAVLTGEPVDVVATFATELPLRTTGSLLGLSDVDRAWLGAVAAEASTSNPHLETKAALRDRLQAELLLMRRFGALLEGPAKDVPPDTVLASLRDAVASGAVTRREAIGLCREVLVAGAETTVDHLAAVFLLLAREPHLLAQVRDDPAARAALTEEALRLESPFTGFWRRATRDVTLGGIRLAEDALLLVPFGALNRDPAAFPEADRVVLTRDQPRRHLAFGHGIHFCVGAPLARLESQVALATLLPRVKRIELLADPRELRYRPSIQGRGLQALPLRFLPR